MKIDSHRLKIVMAERLITINELAAKLKLSQSLVSTYVNGIGNPKPATVGKIAHALETSVTEIVLSE